MYVETTCSSSIVLDTNDREPYVHPGPFELGRIAMAPQPTDDEMSFRERLRIEALRDPVVETVGHQPHSAYSRRYYLPLIGPSSLLCAEFLAEGLTHQP